MSIFEYLPFPKLVRVARYDTAATAAAGGVDHEAGALVVTNKNDGSPRTVARVETTIDLEGCIETAGWEAMARGPLGNSPRHGRRVVFRKGDLLEAGLIQEANGIVLLKSTDRLDAVLDIETGALVEQIPASPGFYATQVEPVGYGPGPAGPNLVVMTFEERARAPRGSGSL